MALLYQDHLVELRDEALTIKHYYAPFGTSKVIRLSDIDRIEEKEPSMATGKWRIWGTGWFTLWLACDWKRPSRNRIYFLMKRHSSFISGFTVENEEMFSHLAREKGLIRET